MGRKKRKDPYGNPHPQKRYPHQYKKETSWPNLPHRLIKYISKNPNTLRNINFGLATKSWKLITTPTIHTHNNNIIMTSSHRRTTTSTTPQTRLVAAEPTPTQIRSCTIEFRKEYWHYWYKRNREASWYRTPFDDCVAGCSHGLVFARDASKPSGLYYFHPREHYWIRIFGACLPDNIPIRCTALSSPYRDCVTALSSPYRDCVLMVATGISTPAFMFSRQGEWTKQACSVVDPNYCRSSNKKSTSTKTTGDDRLMSFTNMIGFKGKFYALSSQGTLAVIEQVGDGDSDDRFEITALGKTRAVPSVPFRGFKECLIESDGDILLVFLAYVGASTSAFEFVEVYRLGFEDLSWIKMESVGRERTLFVGNDCCVSVSAEKVGCRGNCVYFMQRDSEVWFEFDMEFGSISRAWTDRASSSSGNPLEWDEPYMSREELELMKYMLWRE